ncbi:ATP synthase subunit b' [bacterium HR40]|nr:ATP synthase subunit b' [bacterium HR40]
MQWASLAAALSTLLFAAAAVAAEVTGGEAEHGSGGLPQLDASRYPSQIFWLVVSFALLYWLLSRRALPRVTDILEARQDRIAADLDRAAKLREEAAETQRRYEAMVAEAQERARTMLRSAQERMAADYARRQAQLDAELRERIARAERELAEATDRALAGLEDAAAEVVQAAVAKLAGVAVDREEARAVVARIAAEHRP